MTAVWKTLAVARKEMRQIGRDRRTLSSCCSSPFSSCSSTATHSISTSATSGLPSRTTIAAPRAATISSFVNSGYFDLFGEVRNGQEISRVLDRQPARAVLVIPARFGSDVAAGHPTSVQFIVNGDNANTATTVVATRGPAQRHVRAL